MKSGFSLLALAVAVSGCASGPAAQPSSYVYPQKGQTAERQARDTTECQAWAKQQTGFDPLTDSAKGAGVGALVGAVGGTAAGAAIGAATGNAGTGAAIGAAAGGIGGAGVRGDLQLQQVQGRLRPPVLGLHERPGLHRPLKGRSGGLRQRAVVARLLDHERNPKGDRPFYRG
jgi:hypothetical protein